MSDVVRYEERDAIAVLTIDRPDKLNTLTEAVVAGVADGIDRATKSQRVRAVVLRGEGRVFTAGYDLTAGGAGGWHNPFGAPRIDVREGAWDPVRDYQWMNRNVERFMKIWHSTRSVAPPTAKPWICPITGLGQCQIFMKRWTFWFMNW